MNATERHPPGLPAGARILTRPQLRAWLRTLGYTGQVRLPADLHGSREYATTVDGRVQVYTVRPLITGAFTVTRVAPVDVPASTPIELELEAVDRPGGAP